MNGRIGAGLAGLVAAGMGALLAFLPEGKSDAPPIGLANGTYGHSCCGAITLRDGKMTVAASGQVIDYTIGRDRSAYILTPYYVGPSASGIVVAADQSPLKILLSPESQPTALVLTENSDHGGVYTFRRISQP